MASPVAANPVSHFRLDQQNVEEVTQLILSITVDPVKNLAYYIIPFLATFTSNHLEIRTDDTSQNGLMPPLPRGSIFEEFEQLKQAAGITRSVGLYSSLNHTFSSFGGAWSLAEPIVCIPHHHLLRPEKSYFTAETAADQLDRDIWKYSDNETRFLILRELAHVQGNGELIRLLIKVAFVATLFFVYALPVGILIGGSLILAATGLYLLSERALHEQMDTSALEMLSRRLNDPVLAKEAALSALRKQRAQNMERRETNSICRCYISQSGDNFLDLNHPLLSSRISRLDS